MQVSGPERPSSCLQSSSLTTAEGSKIIVIVLSTGAHPDSRFTNAKSQSAPFNPQILNSWRELKRSSLVSQSLADDKHNPVNKQHFPEMRNINIRSARCSINFSMAINNRNSIRKLKWFKQITSEQHMANLEMNRISFGVRQLQKGVRAENFRKQISTKFSNYK